MSHAPTAALSRRHQIVRDALSALDLDALIVTALPNITYLTNFTGSSAIVIVERARIVFITDFRYIAALERTRGTTWECPGCEVVEVEGSYDATLASAVGRGAAQRVGFEAAHLSVARHQWLQTTLRAGNAAVMLAPSERVVERARVSKDAYEIATLRAAARRLSRAAADVLRGPFRGLTERDVAFGIERRLREEGFTKVAFDTIVASGQNAALPHARPTERTIVEGDLVVLDFGGVYDSYCVDFTRTVSVGRAGDRVHEVYEAVREAHGRAIAAVAPGRSRFDVDAAARDALTMRGLGEAFGHGTGHGLGLEVHEEPRITRRRADIDTADETLAPGMVFTIEPGAYLPEWGGVRIEDDVLVTDTGVEVLTNVTTELLEV